MPSQHQVPENIWNSVNIASMRQPRGPFHDNETKASYILAYRAYEAGKIRSRDVAGTMTDSGFNLVTERTMREWAVLYPDLPEQRARAGYLPSRKLPDMFSDQLRVNIKWATLGQQEHESGSTLADFIKAVAVAVAAIWAIKRLSKPTDIIEPLYETRGRSRIGRVSRRSGVFRVNRW